MMGHASVEIADELAINIAAVKAWKRRVTISQMPAT